MQQSRRGRYRKTLTATVFSLLTVVLASCGAENPDIGSIRREYREDLTESAAGTAIQAGKDISTAAQIGAENVKKETTTFFGWVTDELNGQWSYAKDIARSPNDEVYDVIAKKEEYLPKDDEYRLEEPSETAIGYLEKSRTGENLRKFTGDVEEAAENLPRNTEELSDAIDVAAEEATDRITDAAITGSKKTAGKIVSRAAETVRNYADGVVRNIEAPSFTVPDYSGDPYAVINDNRPFFTEYELNNISGILLSSLDPLGRCGPAEEMVGPEMLPTEQRGEIGMVKPSGWHQAKYECLKNPENPAGYLYARCHLLAYCLSGLNAEERNLITGTLTQFNVVGMEPFELETLSYVKKTGNHVLYRVTPVFKGVNLVADGVLMEALSVEDDGLSFCVFVYNNTGDSGVEIDYLTGESRG